MKYNVMHYEVEGKLHAFLTSALNGGEWSDSCPGHFTAQEKNPSTTGWEAEWAADVVWTLVVVKKSCSSRI
jgi:hypothetical protein